MPGLVALGVRDLLVSSSFLKILSIHFSWLTAKLKIPPFVRFFLNLCLAFKRFLSK